MFLLLLGFPFCETYLAPLQPGSILKIPLLPVFFDGLGPFVGLYPRSLWLR